MAYQAEATPATVSQILWDARILAAFIGFGGTLTALFVKDVFITPWLARRARAEAVADRLDQEHKLRRDVVRAYADPLLQAVISLKFRLREIVEQKRRWVYLSSDRPTTEYYQYKYISTLYRLGAILGWIRAVRKERSYLDPQLAVHSDAIDKSIEALEKALADGPHVEEQRLDHLLTVWNFVTSEAVSSAEIKRELATELENLLHRHISTAGVTTAGELSPEGKLALCRSVAQLVSSRLNCDVPSQYVEINAEQICGYLGIREAWIYRDWQSAIGDWMLVEVKGDSRAYTVVGFGEFEQRYRKAEADPDSTDGLWVRRLASVFVDVDISKQDIFDARRDQIKNLYSSLLEMEKLLLARIQSFQEISAGVNTRGVSSTSIAKFRPVTMFRFLKRNDEAQPRVTPTKKAPSQ